MSEHEFDRGYWERHWTGEAPAGQPAGHLTVHPYLAAETADLPLGSALDAGCGAGTEALWLAARGWSVTGADISTAALSTAAARAEAAGLAGIAWVQADLTAWEPGRTWDLVVTSYAHPATGQLAFYRHLAPWVAPGGTLLIVAHGQGHSQGHGEGHRHPEHATAAAADITDLFSGPGWRVGASYERRRTVAHGGGPAELDDVVVRLHRH